MLLESIPIQEVPFDHYTQFLSSSGQARVGELSRALRGKRIVHVNATEAGGGVAEILQSLIPLERSVGLESRWRVIRASHEFFVITKKLHNALQGSNHTFQHEWLTEDEQELYRSVNREIALELTEADADLYLIHDPQPLTAGCVPRSVPTVARVHIDLSHPDPEAMQFVLPCLSEYARVVFSLPEYVPAGFPKDRVVVIAPAIDPLAGKNTPMERADAAHMLGERFNIDATKPLVAQVSRFDYWKDPLGVIAAFHIVKKEILDAQLILLGSASVDDPESSYVFSEVEKEVAGDTSIILLTEHSDTLVNAVQTAADVVVQKSIREGFGLTATEAMWKGRPVVAGNVGGLAFQIENGVNGFLADSVEEAAMRIIELLKDPTLRARMGERAHESVRERFLIPMHLLRHLELYNDVFGS